jgi:hypothetical protein
MLRGRRFLNVGFTSLLFCASALSALSNAEANADRISFPIQEWLSQGERQAFKCKVHVSHSALTYQQRYLVWVTASVDTNSLQARGVQRDLHFILKVADQDGKWFDKGTYNTFQVKRSFEVPEDIQFVAGLYLQPGAYKVAVIVYDAILKERNVSFTRVVVKPQASSLFPDDLPGIPQVEFLQTPVEGLAAIGSGHVHLPVQSKRPVQLDVIIDLASNAPIPKRTYIQVDRPDPPLVGPFSRRGGERETAVWRPPELPSGMRDTEKGYQTQLLEAGSVLSSVEPTNGCTRVTIINSLSRRAIMTQQPALLVDWRKVWEDVVGAQLNLVSADELSRTAQAPQFLHDHLQMVMNQAPVCSANVSDAVRVLAILSFGANFPRKDSLPTLQLACTCRIFYFQERQSMPPDAAVADDLAKMLAPLRPIHLRFSAPQQFQGKISEFLKAFTAMTALSSMKESIPSASRRSRVQSPYLE